MFRRTDLTSRDRHSRVVGRISGLFVMIGLIVADITDHGKLSAEFNLAPPICHVVSIIDEPNRIAGLECKQ